MPPNTRATGPTPPEKGSPEDTGPNTPDPVQAPVVEKALVETGPGEVPDDPKNALLRRAQLLAPNLTPEFVAEYELSDEDLEAIASGSVPPPPYNGPIRSTDLHRTPGGWQSTPRGVSPSDVGKNAISR